MSAVSAPRESKDILNRPRTIPLPQYKRCPKCGLQFDRSTVTKSQVYCAPCRADGERERKRVLAVADERKRLLASLRDVSREGRNRRDALDFAEEFIRIYHGPAALAARLQELDADLRAKGDLANQVRLFEAVLTVLSRASVTD